MVIFYDDISCIEVTRRGFMVRMPGNATERATTRAVIKLQNMAIPAKISSGH